MTKLLQKTQAVWLIQGPVWFVKFVTSNFNEFLDKNGPYMSAAIAFYAFFTLFPLSLALITIFSFFLGIKNFEDSLITGLETQIPVLAEQGDEFLSNFFLSLRSGRGVTSAVAVLGLIFASKAVFSSIRKSVNTIWGITKTRPFLTEQAMDFALLIGASILLIVSFSISTIFGFFQEVSTIVAPNTPVSGTALWAQIARLSPPLLSFIVFLIIYWWLPNTKLRFKEVFPTALLGAAAFEISKSVFILYIRNAAGLASGIYGGVSAIIVLMVFVYVSAIIMLVGAQVTSRWAFYLATREQQKQNEELSLNLARIRSKPSLPGLPLPVPTGAAVSDHWPEGAQGPASRV
jgi:membrane protein